MKFEHLTRWLFKVQGFIAWFKHMRKHKIDVPHPFLSPRSQSTKNLGLGRFGILLGVCDAISMLAIWQGASGWCGGHQRLAARQFWEQSSRFGDKCGNGVSRFIYISLSIFIFAIILLLQVYIYIYNIETAWWYTLFSWPSYRSCFLPVTVLAQCADFQDYSNRITDLQMHKLIILWASLSPSLVKLRPLEYGINKESY